MRGNHQRYWRFMNYINRAAKDALRSGLLLLSILLLSTAAPSLVLGHINQKAPAGNPKSTGGASNGGPNDSGNGQAATPGVSGKAQQAVATGDNGSDSNCNCPQDPVYLSYGTTFISEVDVPTLPFNGQTGDAALGFNRFYGSGVAANNVGGPLGIGWTHNYNIVLTTDYSTSVTITRWDGRQITFTGYPSFVAPAGESSTLSVSGTTSFIWRLQHGTTYTFNYSTRLLSSIKDRQGNTLTLNYTGGNLTTISDGTGRQIAINYNASNLIQYVIDPLNQTNTFTYSGSLLTQVSDSLGIRATYFYDDTINNPNAITRVRDARTNTHSYAYDITGAVTVETNALSNTQTYTWDFANWFVTVTNYNGNWAFSDSFDSSGRQLSYTNSLGTIKYNLDSTTGLLTNYVDLMGYSTTNTWDTSNYALLKTVDPLPVTNSWSYDSVFRYVTNFTSAAGNTARYAYDGSGNLTNYADAGTFTNTYAYDSKGNRVSFTDPDLHMTQFGYDSAGKLTSLTNALTNVWRMGYDAIGRLTSITNPLTQTNGFTWDARSRLTQTFDYASTNKFGYDGNGNVTSWTNALTYVTQYGFDAMNRLTNVTLPAGGGAFLSLAYDKVGNLTRINNALGYTNSFGYDTLNRLTNVTDAVNKSWGFTMNKNGWRTQSVDPNTHTNQFNYDADGRLIAWTNGLFNKVQYQYSSVHRLTNIVAPLGNALSFGYQNSVDDRLTQIQFGSGDTEQFVYDPAGNRTNFVNRAGQTVKYIYDAANRLTEKDFVSAADVMKFGYDTADRLTSGTWTAGAGVTNSILGLAYDTAGRLTNEAQTVGTATLRNVGYEYYADGRRKKLVYPDGTYITYQYSNNGWLTNILDNGTTSIASFQYDAAGRRTQRNLGNSSLTTYQYDADGHLTNLVHKTVIGGVTNTLSSYAYGYDAAGNRKWVKRSNGLGDVFTYDAADQLTNVIYEATNPDGSPGAGTSQVTYKIDAAGNWTNVVSVVPGVSTNTTVYQVNGLNEYTNVAGATRTYDTKGNLSGSGGSSYQYDYENRLGSCSVSGTTYTNTYDVLGRWVGRLTGGAWTRYYYAGWQLIEERDNAGNQLAKYVYGSGLDEIIRMTRNGTNYYYHADGLGSVMQVTDGTEAVVEKYTYDVYGTPSFFNGSGGSIGSSAIGNRILFQGRDRDPGYLLYNFRNRIYAQGWGRFLQTDPIRWRNYTGVTELGSINFYTFVGNDPVNFIDPYGLHWTDWVPDWSGDFGAGLGDNLSFGLTRWLRGQFSYYDDVVDPCSSAYSAGQWTGVGVSLATGVAGGVKAAGVKGLGKEFSHWIPNRLGGPRSIWNGNYVTPARHYLHDPFRFPPGWRDLGPKLNPFFQQLDRLPRTIIGTGVGAGYGFGSKTFNDVQY